MKLRTSQGCKIIKLLLFVVIPIVIIIILHFTFETQYLQNYYMLCNRMLPVLFGFSLTVLAIIGNIDSIVGKLPKKYLNNYKHHYLRKISKVAMLGILYLFTLIFGIILEIQYGINNQTIEIVESQFNNVFIIVATLSIFYSLFLPIWVYQFYKYRYELQVTVKEIIESEKKEKRKNKELQDMRNTSE